MEVKSGGVAGLASSGGERSDLMQQKHWETWEIHTRNPVSNPHISYFSTSSKCQRYMLEVSMVTDGESCIPTVKGALAAATCEQRLLKCSKQVVDFSSSCLAAETRRDFREAAVLKQDLPNMCWSCVIGCGA